MIKEALPELAPRSVQTVWLHDFPRWVVGSVLIATGTGKALNIPGFADVLAAYALLPPWGNVILAHTLPVVELGTGLCLLTRIWLRPAAWVAVGLHIVLLGVVGVTLMRGLAIDNCGCFGVFLARPLSVQTVVEDAVMLGMSLLVLREVRHRG